MWYPISGQYFKKIGIGCHEATHKWTIIFGFSLGYHITTRNSILKVIIYIFLNLNC